MISEQTIKRVIGICEGWGLSPTEPGRWITAPGLRNLPLHMIASNQAYLDALAAEAVRVVNALDNAWVDTKPGWCVIRDGEPLCSTRDLSAAYGPDETENRLNAVDQLIQKHPEVFAE